MLRQSRAEIDAVFCFIDPRLGGFVTVTDAPFIAPYTHMVHRTYFFPLPPLTFTPQTGKYLLWVYTPSFPRCCIPQRAAIILPASSLM
jgi:hypothetical protein